jgi:hypothetical protein
MKVSVGLIRCGRCGQRYSNPLKHVCSGRRRGRTRVKPKLSVVTSCPSCGKQASLTHVCSNKGDFARRQRAVKRKAAAAERKAAAAERRRKTNERIGNARRAERHRANQRLARERERSAERVKAARAKARPARKPGRPRHDYRNCRDADCERVACEAYREGVEDGADAERAQ